MNTQVRYALVNAQKNPFPIEYPFQ